MAARIIGVVVAYLLLAPVTLTKVSLADSIGRLGTESAPSANAGHDGLEIRIPIPNNVESDQDGTPTRTLELRLATGACPGVAQLVELTSKCQLVGSRPLNLKAPMVSHRR